MATFGSFDNAIVVTTPVFQPDFQLITLMSPLLYTNESGDNLIHRYEIGGVVFNTHWELESAGGGADTILVSDSLISQRLDNAGAPVGAFAVGLSTEPVGVNDETELPTHVYHSRDASLVDLSGATEGEALRFARPQDRGHGPVSVRIRKALDDYTGLFLQGYATPIKDSSTNFTLSWSAWGQVYFRSRT